MNYLKIHDQIIARAKSENRVKTKGSVYYERHHIIPKCLGGSNDKENLVLLTGREHFLVHWLLAEIHNSRELWWALHCMLRKSKYSQGRYYPSSRIISMAKEKFSKFVSEYPRTKETRKKLSDFARTRTGSKNSNYGNKRTIKTYNKIIEGFKKSGHLKPIFIYKIGDKDLQFLGIFYNKREIEKTFGLYRRYILWQMKGQLTHVNHHYCSYTTLSIEEQQEVLQKYKMRHKKKGVHKILQYES